MLKKSCKINVETKIKNTMLLIYHPALLQTTIINRKDLKRLFRSSKPEVIFSIEFQTRLILQIY